MFIHLRKILIPLFLVISIIIIGVVGFIIIEKYSLVDAFYMTIITVATVGFGEVHPLSQVGKLFTSFLIITSFSTFAYAVTSLTQYVADGEFNRNLKLFRMQTAIDKLSNHVIICGYGRNGKQAAHVLKNQGQRFVIIEQKQTIVDTFTHEYKDLVLCGDASHDDVLIKAGIHRASALITTLPIDADNLFIVLSARQLKQSLTIISRASDDNSDKKLYTAGATNVIMPDKIGGAHMASLVMKPDVIEFIDKLSSADGLTQNLVELTFDTIPEAFLNKTIKELEVRNRTGANIVGFKSSAGQYVINPSPETTLTSDAKLFVLGSIDQIEQLKILFKEM
ncbi:MAG: potassium channel protein [Bacteroidia bacterium]|nr:potassium channel protein [Bacteroidia bacterium]